jgi:hypothetical protein
MKRTSIGTFALAFALSGISLAAAQDRTSNGNTTGSAAPRGGDSGGGGAVSRGGDSGGSSGSSSSGGSSGGSVSAPSGWSSHEAPRRADEPRSRSGQAVSRGGGNTAASAGGDGEQRRAVPAHSRPRDGRTLTGTAVERGSVPPPAGGGGNGIIYYPYYYNPWSYWGPGYGYGLGYLFYDPWYGSGYGWGNPYGGYGGYGYGGGYGGGSGGYAVSREYRESGNLRLKIDPKQAQVYVDGYYVGVVDSFDGAFQKLGLDSGDHKIELKAEGFEPLQFDVLITPGETVTYKGEMKRTNK